MKKIDTAHNMGRLEESLYFSMSHWDNHPNFASETRWVREGYPPQIEHEYTDSISGGILSQFLHSLKSRTNLNMKTAWRVAIFNALSDVVSLPFSESDQNSRDAYEYSQTAQLQFSQELVSPIF